MIFYGNGIVWNPKENKALARFVDGKLETENAETIDIMKKQGYKHTEERVAEAIVDEPIKVEPIKVKRGRKS